MKLRLRTMLLASAAPVLALPTPGAAVDVGSDRNTPIETATIDNGAPGDVNILSGVTVELDSGAVVTVNSDNSLTNTGTIRISDSDDAVGVRVLGGFTGTIDNRGQIVLDEDFTRQDQDSDGTLDGPFAQGSGRTGILIEGAAPFTGDIRNTGSIAIEGNDSRGVDLQTTLAGSFLHRGSIAVTGDRSVGADLGGGVTGDVWTTGSIAVTGEDSSAIVVGDVGGGVSVGGAVRATGFQFPTISDYVDPDQVPPGFQPPPFDEDDLKNGGAAFVVAGSVTDGVLVSGAVGGGGADDDEDGNDDTKDIKGDFDENRSTGSITAVGSSPAVLISPELASGDIVIGVVVERIHDTRDDDDDGDSLEVIAEFLEEHGVINRGTITANGLNVGFDANAIVISGSADGTRSTTIEGGVLNAGNVTASAFEANATAVRFGSGAQLVPDPANPGVTPRFDNTGVVSATIATETNHTVTVLLIEADSMVSALTNSGSMTATARGDGANVFAIRDLSGTLLSIDNTGAIVAAYTADGDDNDADEIADANVAIDLSSHGSGQGATIVQRARTPTTDVNGDGVIDQADVPAPRIVGDVLLGAGDDEVELLAGTMAGDLAFGAGADSLTLGGGARFTGALSDSDGRLAVVVGDADMVLTGRDDVTVTSLSLGDGSTTSFSVDLRDGSVEHTRIIASDVIEIAGGAAITPQFVGLGTLAPQQIEILRAEGGLTLTDGQSIADNLAVQSPFLFESTLETGSDGAADTVVVTVRRRSAEELGMTANQAAAYEPVVAALNSDTALLEQIVNLTTAEEFFPAYGQLLPEYSLAVLQTGVATIDGAIGAVGTRLDVVRGGRSGAGAVWLQEFALYMDRERTVNDPGYRGSGFGFAAGVDRPLWPFYAVGVTITGSASEMEQPDGFDSPLAMSSAQLGAYAAANLGNLLFDVYAGAGADFFDSERQVIVGDVVRQITGEWKGHHATASARLGYDVRVRRLFARPALSVDYLRIDEEPYREVGQLGLRVEERSSELFSTTASLTLGARFGDVQRTWWSPRMRLGYRYENMGHAPITTARFLAGGDPFVLRADDLPEAGGLVGFTFAAGSRYSSFALDYDADIRDGFTRHGLRVAFRFIF